MATTRDMTPIQMMVFQQEHDVLVSVCLAGMRDNATVQEASMAYQIYLVGQEGVGHLRRKAAAAYSAAEEIATLAYDDT